MSQPEPRSGDAGGHASATEPCQGKQVARAVCEGPWAPPEAQRWSVSASEVTPTLATILASLPPDHADVIRRHLTVPRWELRALRLAQRAEAIREARALIAPDARPSQAADTLVASLRRYVSIPAWAVEQHLAELPVGASPRRIALHRILKLNGGRLRGLGFRTVLYAIEAEDGPA